MKEYRITCDECEEVYQIVTESDEEIICCPFCGEEIDLDEEDDEDEDYV